MALPYEFLKARQSLPLESKIAMSMTRIREWVEHFDGDVYVSYSGGKDSTVLLDIVRSVYPDVPAVFCDTGLEYPEVRELALRKADVVLKPKMSFKQVIEKYGYPFPSKEQAQYIWQYRNSKSDKLRDLRMNGRGSRSYTIAVKWRFLCDAPFEVSEKCCSVMKKAPFRKYEKETGRKPMIATMAVESTLRTQEYLQHGCNAFDTARSKSTPLGFWTEQDVLRYLKETGIEYAGCYGHIVSDANGNLHTTGTERTGCMFCLFGVANDGTPNRFQRMDRDYPKQYDYCINKLGIGAVLDYVGIPYRYEPTLFDMEGGS